MDAAASVAAVASTAAGSLLVEAIVGAVAVAVEAMRLIRCEQTAPLSYKVQRYFLLGRGPRCSTQLNCGMGNASEEAAMIHWILHGDGTRSLVSG